MKNTFRILLSTFAILAVIFVGCKDEEEYGDPDRLFRPIIKETSVGQQWIRVGWDRFEGVQKYVVEVSTVADSFSVILQTVETTDDFCLIEGLDFDTQYYVRIKSVGNELQSAYYLSEIIKTDDYPTKLLTPANNDVIDVAIKVTWIVDSPVYDRIDVYRASTDSLVKSIALTPEQYALGEIIISGLGSNTNYNVKAYASNDYQGKKGFRTAVPQVFEGHVVDLRGLSESAALSALSPTLLDTIPDGTTVILDGGAIYNLSSTMIVSKSVHFITGLSFYGRAVIGVDSNFDLSGNGANQISFKNIFFTEGVNKKRNADANFGGTYIFNLGFADASAGSISLDGCVIKYKRGVIRIKTGNITVDNITINNCQIDSIAGYGIVNVDADALVKTIAITNSTIAHAQKILINTKGKDNESVIFSSNTLYSAPNAGQYIIDLNGKVVNSIEFKNNIIGPAYGECNGIRSSAKDVSIDGNYITSDFSWAINAGTGFPNAPIDPIETTVSSVDLFTNPDAFDFKLKVALKAGDPRWR